VGFEGVGDGEEHVTVYDVSVGGWVVHVALYEAEGSRTVCKEVGMAELEAYIYARRLRAINGVRGRGECHQNFDARVRGGVSGGRSNGGGASFLGAVRVYEVLPIPCRFSFGGGVY
jgi:hypothetical protein